MHLITPIWGRPMQCSFAPFGWGPLVRVERSAGLRRPVDKDARGPVHSSNHVACAVLHAKGSQPYTCIERHRVHHAIAVHP